MERSRTRCTDPAPTRRKPWALPLAVATLALCSATALRAQVAEYDLSYDKLLKTASILQADEDAAFEPITGGTVLANGMDAAVANGTTFGVGYSAYEEVAGFFGSTIRPMNWLGNATFVGNAGAGDDGNSDAEYQLSGAPSLKTGPGYPIGFDFTFNGETFDRVGISGQGWISFGNSSNGSSAVAAYTAPTANNSYHPFNETLFLQNDSRRNRVVATGVTGGAYNVGSNIMPVVYNPSYPAYPGAELRYETIGTAPNRVFVVQWLRYGFTINSNDLQYYRQMDFQVRLYEGTNNVEVRFGKAWRSNTAAVFQTGLAGKTGGNGPSGDFSSFGFYDATANAWRNWPYAWTAQAEHNGYSGSTAFSQRIPWDGPQGYTPYNSYGSGSAEDFFATLFTQLHSNAGTGPNGQNFAQALRTTSGGQANTPDMMSFLWEPPACAMAHSNVTAIPTMSSVTLNWNGTGDFVWAVDQGSDPDAAAFTGSTSGNTATVGGLQGGTAYNAWVATACSGGGHTMWTKVSFGTLPCQVPISAPGGYGIFPISLVQIGDINNASTNTTDYYENFMSIVGQLENPLSYPITVEGGASGYTNYATAFLDWNGDGVFEDRQEIGSGTTSATGTIVVPGDASGTAIMRIVWSMYQVAADACSGPYYGGQTEDYSLNVTPATCMPVPTASLAVTGTTAYTADFAWASNGVGNEEGYIWEVRSSGSPGDPSPEASGTTVVGVTTTTVSGLTSNTSYTFYVRADCGATDGQSPWISIPFTTQLGCGITWDSPGGYNSLTDVQFIDTWTICPDNVGDVVSIDFTYWGGLNWNIAQASRLFIYDGEDTNAPMVPGGNGTAYTSGAWTVPAGGWTDTYTNGNANKPPTYTSTAASGCLTIKAYSYGSWTTLEQGWRAEISCAPRPTCFAPTDRTVTSTTVHEGNFSWNAGDSPNVEWIVVANGNTPDGTWVDNGSSSTGTATASGLDANTAYTAFFRGLCDDQGVGDDMSAWSSPGLNFTTQVGCGGPYNIFYRASDNTAPFDSVMVICPDNVGDVVTYTVNGLNLGGVYQGTALFVYDGPDVNSEMFNSGLAGYTSGVNSIPAGGYYGNTYLYYPPSNGNINNLPAPFVSSHASGCLTVRFRSVSIDTYYNKPVLGTVSCSPAPACSTPNQVSFSNIGGNEVTVSWSNTTEPCIIEYGPVGFTPGTGATAGTNGTVVSGVTSPAILSGLASETTFDVYVRQACDGPTYSSNSMRGGFSTSMDCSLATVLSCATSTVEAFDDVTGSAAYHSFQFTGAPDCFAGYSNGVNGQTFLYKITADLAGDYQLNFTRTSGYGNEYFLTTPVEDGCAASAFTCVGGSYYIQEQTYATSHTTGSYTFHLDAGDHYILMKGSPEAKTVDFNVLCPGIPQCVPAPTFPANGSIIAVNSNPIQFSWPAAFGATGYDVYFNGSLVVSNYPSNSISDASYTSANMAALFGLGNNVTWRVVPRNSFGTASCPTDWTFRVGGNGAAYAVEMSEGVMTNGNNLTANGYTNQYSTYWGEDFWTKFTASACADSAHLEICVPGTNYTTMYITVLKASDNSVVSQFNSSHSPAEPCGIFPYVFDYDWYWETYEERYILGFPVDIDETYYVVVDRYGTGYEFNLTYHEMINGTDSDEDGIPDCMDSCPFTPGQTGDVCDAGPGYGPGTINEECECVGELLDCLGVPGGTTLPGTACDDGDPNTWDDMYDSNCACVGTPCNGEQVEVVIHTNNAPTSAVSWVIYDQASAQVAFGGPYSGQPATTITANACLPTTNGNWYRLMLMDPLGNGLCCDNGEGYWEIRDMDGKVLLHDVFDNTVNNNYSPSPAPQSSAYGFGHSFALPAGPVDIAPAHCGVFTNLMGNKVYATKQTGNNYQGQTLNYQFEFSDPDAGFIRRIARPYNYVLFSDMVTNPLTPGVKYFARVRTDKDGAMADAHWGGGCEMGIGTAVLGCSELINCPAYGHSCNEERSFNTNNSFIYAQPITGATQYQFRITNANEQYDETFTRNTYILQLKWNSSVAAPLTNGSWYNVEINAKVNGVWSGFCPSACTITINNALTSMPDCSVAQQSVTPIAGETTLWPNPVKDGQVNISVDGIRDAEQHITVDVVNLYGQHVFGQEFGNSGERFNAIINLPGDVASGIYMVNITINGEVTTKRLSIVR